MKREKSEKIEAIQNTLESYRRFDYDYIPFGPDWTMPDGNFPYRKRGFRKLHTAFWRTVLQIFAPWAIKIVYGARVVGKKNLKPLKKRGAICVMNHFNYLDTLFVRAAVGHYRSYHTMGPWNNKKGLGGHIIRGGGMLPLSANLCATKNFIREVERLLQKGKIINFYPEQAMWGNYQKPRPMKEGAFFYAVRFNVPVLPIFCTFRKNKRGHAKQMRIHILPAIEPRGDLPKQERINEMRGEAQAAWKKCYEQSYGVPLEYLPDVRKNSNPTA